MQRTEATMMTGVGKELRLRIKEHKQRSGRSYQHLSSAIKKEPNYIASYLCQSAEKWAIPKHPSYGLLLRELGVTEDELAIAAKAKAKALLGDRK